MMNYRKFFRRYGFMMLVVALVLGWQVLPGPRPVDDAYITFRYARNLVRGVGFVYNPGEPVLGTTTPLYTLLLAGLSALLPQGDLPWLAVALNAACDVLSVWLLWRLVQGLGQPPLTAALIAAAYLFSPLRIGVALGGMETSLVVLWLIAASEFYVVRENEVGAALFCALAVLTRPDAVLLPMLLMLYELIAKRRFPWRALFIFLLVVGPWLLFSQAYFGSILPNSIAAKTGAYFVHPAQALATLLGFMATRSPLNGADWPLWAVGLSLVVIFTSFLSGALASVKVKHRALPLAIYPIAYWLGLSLGNPLLFFWYYPPLIWAFDMFTLLGVATLAARISVVAREVVLTGVIVGLIIIQWVGLGPFRDQWSVDLRQREFAYAAAAPDLASLIEPDSKVALPEIGVLGYVLDRAYIIDTVGLVSPQAIPYRLRAPAPDQTINYAIANEAIAQLRPDYVITLEIFARPTLLQSSQFLKDYQLVRTFAANDFDSRGLLVFKRTER